MTFKIYLAGPITGENWSGATDWRTEVADKLSDASDGEIRCYSPLRGKDYDFLVTATAIGDQYENTIMTSQRGIFARDRFDCMSSDLVFVNFLDSKRVSIGTVMEIAWANSRDIPIVLVMPKEGNQHDHSMLREACPFQVETLEEGMLLAAKILLP